MKFYVYKQEQPRAVAQAKGEEHEARLTQITRGGKPLVIDAPDSLLALTMAQCSFAPGIARRLMVGSV